MKIKALIAVLVLVAAAVEARAATVLVLFSSKDADAVQMFLDEWKNEKVLAEKLLTPASPEVVTGVTAGQAVVLGVCDAADAEPILPILVALYPRASGKTAELSVGACPKPISATTKVVTKLSDRVGNFTLHVALFQGSWDKEETTQLVVGHVRNKFGDLVDTYFQRAGTVLGGEKCAAELKQTGHVISVSRHCEGTKDVDVKKLSISKGQLKIDSKE